MLRLRPYKKCDAQHIIPWLRDERSFYQWCAGRYDHYPISAQDMNDHYDAFAAEDWFYPMTAFDESGVAGHLIMRFTDEKKECLRFGFIIVDGSRRGQGLGREMLKLALRYAFDFLGAKQVTLGVFENNPAAYRCYLSVGFRECDTPKTYTIMGENWTCLELGVAP